MMRQEDNGLGGMLCIPVDLGRDHDGTFVRGKERMRTCTQELGARGFGVQGLLALDLKRERLPCRRRCCGYVAKEKFELW